MEPNAEHAGAESSGGAPRKRIPHPRFGDLRGLLSGIESALSTHRKVTGRSLVELFYLSEMDRYGMVRVDKYLDESSGYPLQDFRSEINKCVTAVRGRMEKGEIPDNWNEELMDHLGIEKGKR
jgi:hypothetical protein